MTAYATINGQNATSVTVQVPNAGAWFADVDLETDPDVSGSATIKLGELELRGTVVDAFSGTHGLQRRVRVVAGGAGWGKLLAPKHYHNDSGVRARSVVDDAAREAGESLASGNLALAKVGVDYVRTAGPAAQAIENVVGAVPWWVDFDGVTHVETRSETQLVPASYEVLDFDPREQIATVAAGDLRVLAIGAWLTERLDEPQVIREMTIEARAESVRVRAWCGGASDSRGRVAGLFRALVDRVTDRKLFGLWRYRVVQMSSDRVELQAVRREAGLPNALPISMWPGVAGAHAEPQPGAEVLVQFIEGDRTMPIVAHFAGKDGTGWAPTNLTFDILTELKLGKDATNYVALANLVKQRLDSIQSTFDGHIHTTTATVGVGGVATITPPTSTIGVIADVAAQKVKAQ